MVYRGILIGDKDCAYGNNLQDGILNVSISNIIYNSTRYAIHLKGYLRDSAMQNVKLCNLVAPEGVEILHQL